MKDVRFSGKLSYSIDNIGFISVLRNKSYTVPYRKGKDKFSVIFVERGKMIYSFQNGAKPLELTGGMMIFVPKGCPYVAEYTSDNTLMKLLVFDIFSDNIPSVFLEPFVKVSSQLSDIFHSINHSNSNNTAFLAAKTFELLYVFEKENEIIPEKYKKIIPALDELNRAYFDNKKLSYYSDMCNMSLSNFRKLFKEYTGQSVIDYRNTIRIYEAKKMITGGEASKSAAAYLCGFNNMSFFYKLYNKYRNDEK